MRYVLTENEGRISNSIRNIIAGFLGQIICMLFSFVGRTIFIRYLSAEYLGINGLFTNILSILSLAELGVGSAIIYALYKPIADNDEDKISILMEFYKTIYISIGFIIGILGLLLIPFLKYIIKDNVSITESIYVIYLFYLFNTTITYFYSYKNSIIEANQKNYIVSLVKNVTFILQAILQIIVLMITKNFIYYLLMQSICVFINNFMVAKIANRMYPFLKQKEKRKLDSSEKKDLIKNIRALMIVKISGVLVNNTDNIIISYFSGVLTLGYVSNYNIIINSINSIINQLFNSITASIGNLNAREEKAKKLLIFDAMSISSFWIFGLATVGIIVLTNDIINVWLGGEYVLHLSIPIVLSINFYMAGMQNVVNIFKNTMGLFVYGKYVLFFTAIINLYLSFSLGNKYGIVGIFIATAIARLLTNVWYHSYIVCKYGLKRPFKEYIIQYVYYAIVLVITTIVTYYSCSFVVGNCLVIIIKKIVICLTVPNVIFLITLFNTNGFKYFKNLLINRVFRKKDKIKVL